MAAAIDLLVVGDDAAAWRSAGFAVDCAAVCRIGGVGISLVGRDRGTGILGWGLRGLPDGWVGDDLDGVPTTSTGEALVPASPGSGEPHPNGVLGIDHLVLLSPDLARTVTAFAAVGAEPRLERDGELGGRPVRQIFFRFGEVVVEVVGAPGSASPGRSTLWGITYEVADLDRTAAYFGDRTSPVKDAVQPGRRISTLRHRVFDLSVRTALISAPEPHGTAGRA